MICFRLFGISLYFEFGFFAVFGLLCTLSTDADALRASVWAVFLHEGAHFAIMAATKQRVHSITFYGCGIRIRPAHVLCDYRRELAVLLAGPLSNLLAWGIIRSFGGDELLADAQLVLGLVNLLPCRHLDGGAALRCLFNLTPWALSLSERMISVIACMVLLGMLLAGVLLDIRNFTYYVLCLYLFFAEIFW